MSTHACLVERLLQSVFCGLVVGLVGCIDPHVGEMAHDAAADAFAPGDARLIAELENTPLPLAPCPGWPEGIARRCGSVSHPRHYDGSAATIDIGYVYLPAQQQPARAHLWILTGGPGSASTLAFAGGFHNVPDDVDTWLLDVRGTGTSSRLSCNAESESSDLGTTISRAEFAGCLAELQRQDLSAYGTIENAMDLGILMQRARITPVGAANAPNPTVPIWLFGTSYGTLLGQRTMRLFPNRVAAAVLQGVVPQGQLMFPTYGYNTARDALKEGIRACLQTDSCRTGLHATAEQDADAYLDALTSAVANIADCAPARSAGVTPELAAVALGALTDADPFDSFYAQVLNAILDCPDDAAPTFSRIASVRSLVASTHRDHSPRVLVAVVLASELSELSNYNERAAARAFGVAPPYLNLLTSEELALASVYARRAADSLSNIASQTRVQVWNGLLDGRTSYSGARAVATSLGGSFVGVPLAGHGINAECFSNGILAFHQNQAFDTAACAASAR